jgi:signal transduction histidine kinase
MDDSLKNNDHLNEIKITLKSVDLFQESTSRLLEHIASSIEEIHFRSNGIIFQKGDQVPGLYIIKQGKVKIHDGDYQFAVFDQYDFFGEYSLIDSSVRSASVTALEDTTLLRLNEDLFYELLDRDFNFARVILKKLINRLRRSNLTEEYLSQKSQSIKLAKDELEEKKTWLERMNATKDKFFSIIAHDLKNPFNTIIGLSELLMYRYENYSPEKIKSFIEQIYRHSTSAYNLLDNLLQWARSQTGRLEVHPQELDIDQLVEENINILQNKARQKEIQISVDVEDNAKAYADKNMVNTILRNLLSNAIKFTPRQGKIEIHAYGYDKESLKISVIDNGMGIKKDDIPKIFDFTSNFTTKGTESEEGTGLGMILCKDFVEKNQGEIWVESEKDKGSAFHFTLPKAKS